jgi:ABC-type dipeptide/oligopeptide/nickel transport system ATPase component
VTQYADCRFCKRRKTYHGPECMGEWISWAQHQVPPFANQHTATALVGERGAGKSGGGICIFKQVQTKPFMVREQVYFRPSDRIHVARRLGKGFVVYGDESTGEGGHKRRAMSTANVDNVMDIDTMRERNQHTVFTGPDLTSFDPLIQECLQWVHEFNKAHEVVSYEVIHSGKPDNRFHYLKERFRTEDFPHAEFVFPDTWRELRAMKADYLSGKEEKGMAQRRAMEEKMERAIINVVQAGRIKPAPTPFPGHLA